jgi:hypothetical protein
LLVVLCGCETCFLTLWEENRLREFENRMPRKNCGPKWEKRTNNWRKLHNEQLLDLYSSPEIITVITQASGIFGEGEKACWVFGGET